MVSFLNISTGFSYEMKESIALKVKESLSYLKKYGKAIQKGDTVAIKVNIPVPLSPEYAASTHPEVLKAVIGELNNIGAKVTVYEDCYSEKAPVISGILDAALECGVDFINLNNRKYNEVVVGGITYKYYEDILKADHLVSIPKFKTHIFTNYSGAIKNMYGCIIKEQRKDLHRYTEVEDFSKILADIYSIKIPTLVVMDGIVGMEGLGPTHGTPIEAGLLIISNDGVMLDYYATSIMKYDPMQIETNVAALMKGLNKCGIEQVQWLGDPIDNLDLQFNLVPVLKGAMKKRYIEIARGNIEIIHDRCSKCRVCDTSCPFGAISMEEYPVINSSMCRLCYCCLELCPNEAIVSAKKFI